MKMGRKEGKQNKGKKEGREGRMGITLALSMLNPWEYCFKVHLNQKTFLASTT